MSKENPLEKETHNIDPHYQYQKDLEDYPPLDPKEEEELIETIKSGSDDKEKSEAKKRLLEGYLRFISLILKESKEFRERGKNLGISLDDLIQEGNRIFLEEVETAVKNFNPEKGEWTTFLGTHIRNIMRNHLTSLEREKRKPQRPIVSLDETIDIGLSGFKNPEEMIELAELEKKLEKVFKTLTNLEKKIISMRYGLGGYEANSLVKIGRELGISKQAVNQNINRALKKLKRAFS